MAKRIMVDLETLGRSAGCVILSIGAVVFDEITGQLGDTFYTSISRASSLEAGLFEDHETVKWWQQQSDAARAALQDADNSNAPSLREALSRFSRFVGRGDEIWGNGADFDNAILAAAYRAIGMETPWKFWNSRCYRTLKGMRPDVTFDRVGTFHNALDDARTQALHAIALLRAMGPSNGNRPADQLSQAISKYFNTDIGEYSSANTPWENALELITAATPPEDGLLHAVQEDEGLTLYRAANGDVLVKVLVGANVTCHGPSKRSDGSKAYTFGANAMRNRSPAGEAAGNDQAKAIVIEFDFANDEAVEILIDAMRRSLLPLPAESSGEPQLFYPGEMTAALRRVLGMANFQCAPFAHIYRAAGHDIPPRAEDEQAFVLHRFTKLALAHGARWPQIASEELTALRSKIAAAMVSGDPTAGEATNG